MSFLSLLFSPTLTAFVMSLIRVHHPLVSERNSQNVILGLYKNNNCDDVTYSDEVGRSEGERLEGNDEASIEPQRTKKRHEQKQELLDATRHAVASSANSSHTYTVTSLNYACYYDVKCT